MSFILVKFLHQLIKLCGKKYEKYPILKIKKISNIFQNIENIRYFQKYRKYRANPAITYRTSNTVYVPRDP